MELYSSRELVPVYSDLKYERKITLKATKENQTSLWYITDQATSPIKINNLTHIS